MVPLLAQTVLAQVDELEKLDGLLAPERLTAADWIAASVTLVLTLLVSEFVVRTVRKAVGRPGGHSQQLAKLVARVVRIVIVTVGIAVALSFLGLDLGWLTAMVVVLLVIGYFISRPVLESLSAGIALSTRPAFNVGDDIEFQDYEGTVLEITQRSTVVGLRDGRHVHFPNTDVVAEKVVVYTGGDSRRTSLEVEIDERNDLDAAEQAILRALAGIADVLDDPPPRVRAVGFGPASVKLSARFCHEPDLAAGVSALDQAVRAIHDALRDAHIDMATPRLEAELIHHNAPAGASDNPSS